MKTIYAINRYSSSRKQATADPKAPNFHANIEAETPEEALEKSCLRTRRAFRDRGDNTLLLHWSATGAEIWVRPAIPGTRATTYDPTDIRYVPKNGGGLTTTEEQLTVKQSAAIRNVTERRIRAVIQSGRLPAVKMAGVWLIKESDLAKYQPRKTRRTETNKVLAGVKKAMNAPIYKKTRQILNTEGEAAAVEYVGTFFNEPPSAEQIIEWLDESKRGV